MNKKDRLLSSYYYELPEETIAQNAAIPRDSSRLLVVNSQNDCIHTIFQTLPDWLLANDLLILNNTKVIPARIYGKKTTGAPVEILLLEEKEFNCWLCLVKPGKRFTLDAEIIFTANAPLAPVQTLRAKVIARDEATGGRILQFDLPQESSLLEILEYFGQIPLPPYITETQSETSQYQTIYAEKAGAIAAPTAGLHFTPELLTKLKNKGINIACVTLHVGIGTFRPVEVQDITTHKMHQEWVELPKETVAAITKTQLAGGRIIAVGTTVVRTLEGAVKETNWQKGEPLQPYCGKTNLFIYPGYEWKIVDGLITNFHLPRSSLLMLVSAAIGRERLLSLYREAIELKYRFYSFGDAMLILPEAKIVA
jgi:S-adenosylmethionine:tRNA ribosyltransferase-isomerase